MLWYPQLVLSFASLSPPSLLILFYSTFPIISHLHFHCKLCDIQETLHLLSFSLQKSSCMLVISSCTIMPNMIFILSPGISLYCVRNVPALYKYNCVYYRRAKSVVIKINYIVNQEEITVHNEFSDSEINRQH